MHHGRRTKAGRFKLYLAVVFVGLVGTATPANIKSSQESPTRVSDGLIAYFPFAEGSGEVAQDKAPAGLGTHLRLNENVQWLPESNGVAIGAGGKLVSGPARQLNSMIESGGQFTVEIWVDPGDNPKGAAAIVGSGSSRDATNFSLQQVQGKHLGASALAAGRKGPKLVTHTRRNGFRSQLSHYVATLDQTSWRLYRDGRLLSTKASPGELTGWIADHPLSVGSVGSTSFWQGDVFLLAIYGRALSEPEIQANFLVGPGGNPEPPPPPPPVNEAPTANTGPDMNVTLPDAAMLAGSFTDDGLPSNTVMATWTKMSGPGTVQFSSSASPQSMASFSAAGSYVLRLSVSDGELSGSDDVTVQVGEPDPVNSAPVANAGPDVSVTLPDSAVLVGSFTDDGLPSDSVTAAWTKVSGPGDVQFASPSSPQTAASLTAAGAYVLRLTVSDGELEGFDDANVSVNESDPVNEAPSVEAGLDTSISMGGELTLEGSYSDDGLPSNEMTVSWSKMSGPGSVEFSAPSSAESAASFTAAGDYVLRLSVSDGELEGFDELNVAVVATNPVDGARVEEDLIAFYPFNEGAGAEASDQSGFGMPLNLQLSEGVTWLQGRTGVHVPKVDGLLGLEASKIQAAVAESDEVTVEMWATADNLNQSGPARMVSYSLDAYNRNFTLGQAADDIQVRFRTALEPSSALNGSPYLTAEAAATMEPAHYVIAYADHTLSLHKNGELLLSERRPGFLETWNPEYHLVVGDEFGVARYWSGEVHVVALYQRALSDLEIRRNYLVGPDLTNGGNPVPNVAPNVDAGADQTVLVPMMSAALYGDAADDGLPGPGVVTTWSRASGPGDVTFENAAVAETMATFSQPGQYVLELMADDGELQSIDQVAINVTQSPRISENLIAFYPFNEGRGSVARDQSGNGTPLDLHLSEGVNWLEGRNGVNIPKRERLLAENAEKIHAAVQDTNEVSVEVWTVTANVTQSGPARIVSYSYDANNRNFTIGQHLEDIKVRLRTKAETSNDLNGYPYTWTQGIVTPVLSHYMLTYADGLLSVYQDGVLVDSLSRPGSLSSWNPEYALLIGDELLVSRPWTGEVHTVAIYNRALTDVEVDRNYRVGSNLENGGTQISNLPPVVNAGKDRTVLLPMLSATLIGDVRDDGLPGGALSMSWSKKSGPGDVSLSPANAMSTTATFSDAGVYVLELAASDSDLQAADETTVIVTQSPRVNDGLIAFYPLNEGAGDVAGDQSGFGIPLDMGMSEEVSWLQDRNGVSIAKHGRIASGVASKLKEAVVASSAITVEVWIKPLNLNQWGPARVITYSLDGAVRNFTLGQAGEKLELRFRTSLEQPGGYPYLRYEGAFDLEESQYVFTFNGTHLSVYKNGQFLRSEARHEVDLDSWDDGHFLAIGNEYAEDRTWKGEVYLAAIYDRALTNPEIDRNFRVGPNLSGGGMNIGNLAPNVDAGPDQTITLPSTTASLGGVITDDGLPAGAVTSTWSLDSGPGTATFADSSNVATSVDFSAPGMYTLELAATDSELASADQVVIEVSESDRVTRGLIAYYPMTEGGGDVVRDQSGFDVPLDLQISGEVAWLPSGNGVQISRNDGRLLSGTATKLHQTLTTNNEFSLESWTKAANLTQTGPARLISYSHDAYNRNVTLGQQETEARIRLRTTETEMNGMPEIIDPNGFSTNVQHHLVTYDGSTLKFYRDGVMVLSEHRAGDLSNWDAGYALVLGNERTVRRTWEGEMYAAAVYDRALSDPEVMRNFQVGHELLGGGNPVANSAPQVSAGDDRSTTQPRDTIFLNGAAADDGLPADTLIVAWTQLAGPATAVFANPNLLSSAVTFPAPGDYDLRLSVGDGEFTITDDVRVQVIDAGVPRLLEQSTWGATPQDSSLLQAIGPEQYLQQQFNATASNIPDFSSSSASGVQSLFFYNAILGQDQLRQRMAFALHQTLVGTGGAVSKSYQLVPYWRILNQHAFGNYRDLLEDIGLSPTMGDFLDNVNNAADFTGTNPPNENFGREVMQLMTVGRCILTIDGICQRDAQGVPIVPYSEDTVLGLTRALTGWTYPTRPGETPRWRNPSHYVGPMIPFDEFHDPGEKELMNGFIIPAGQTARQDMEMALDHLFNHPNVGPFIASALIQRLVTSNPSSAYVGAVAQVFNDNGQGIRGDLQAVARAILLHPEAQQAPGPLSGKLRPPVVYATTILRNLGVSVPIDNGLRSRTIGMGQNPLLPPSVFSYFSPFYRIPGTGGVVGPEFQIHTISNALNRANFIYRVVNNSIGEGVTVDVSRFTTLVSDPNGLIDEIDATLFQGRMPVEVRTAILNQVGAGGREDRVAKNALYVALTASAYQVQQ